MKVTLVDVPSERVYSDLRYLISEFDVEFPSTDFITVKNIRTGYRRHEYTARGRGPSGERVKYFAMEGSQGDRRIQLWIDGNKVTPEDAFVESMPKLVNFNSQWTGTNKYSYSDPDLEWT